MSKNKKIAAALLTGCLALTACRTQTAGSVEGTQQLHTAGEVHYQTVQVERGEYRKTVQVEVEPVYPVSMQLAPKKEVRFQNCYVEANDNVKAGDVLVSFASDADELELEEYKIRLTRAQEELTEGIANRQTAIQKAEEKLAEHENWDPDEKHSGPRMGVQQRKIAGLEIEKQKLLLEEFIYESQKKIRALEKKVSLLEEKVEGLKLTAPYDGIVKTVKSCREGEMILAGEVMVTLYSDEKMLLQIKDSLQGLRCFSEVTVEGYVENEKNSLRGKVVSAPNVLPAGVEQDFVLVELEEELNTIGKNSLCFFEKEQISKILLTDKRAVNHDDGGTYVYVLEDESLHKRYVVTGFSNSSQVWILDGLSEGQSLVLD